MVFKKEKELSRCWGHKCLPQKQEELGSVPKMHMKKTDCASSAMKAETSEFLKLTGHPN